jgi:hypothetical protein
MNAPTAGEFLQRIAHTLKGRIAPAIEADYPKTQAFMAAVVLQKLGRHLVSAAEQAAAETADVDALLADLQTQLRGGAVPAAVSAALESLARTCDAAALCRLIEALYASRTALGERTFAALLGRVRRTLRRSIDRRMEVAA